MEVNKLKIGFAYDEPPERDRANRLESVEAEYEDAETISWLRSTLQQLGTVVDLPWGPHFLSELVRTEVDVILNITEGAGSRNRESLVPAIAEAKGVPCTGTDALGLGISLDKYLTKVIARHIGIPTPDFVKLDSIGDWQQLEPVLKKLRFPVFAKPNTGGTSMGITNASRVSSLSDLYNIVKWLLDRLADSVLIEEFISGREFSVGLFARPELAILPIAEIRFDDGSPDGFYSYDVKANDREEIICPANPPGDLSKLLADYACRIFDALGCRDIARVDFRVSDENIPFLLEINATPGLSPSHSIIPIQARTVRMPPEDIIHQIVHNALTRGLKGESKHDF
jgi:D-alanine-D-alanine ligase